MTCLYVVIVDGLLSEKGQVERVLLHYMAEDLGYGEGLELLINLHVGHHVDTFVSAHGQGVPDHVDCPMQIKFTSAWILYKLTEVRQRTN